MCIKEIYKEFTCLSEYTKSLGLEGVTQRVHTTCV